VGASLRCWLLLAVAAEELELLLAALALLVLQLMRRAWLSVLAGRWAQPAAGVGLARQLAAAHQAGCTGQAHHHLGEVEVAAAAAAVAAAAAAAAAVALHLSLR
jgi:hypothetical protein